MNFYSFEVKRLHDKSRRLKIGQCKLQGASLGAQEPPRRPPGRPRKPPDPSKEAPRKAPGRPKAKHLIFANNFD